MHRIFLGGTCTGTTWRNEFIEQLEGYNVEWFNPVVEDWTSECQAIEEDEKNHKCDVHLYVLTPEMQGVYSIAEIVNSCWQAQMYGTNVKYVALYILGDWDTHQAKSLCATINLCTNICPNNFEGQFVHNSKNAAMNLLSFLSTKH